MKVKMYVKGRVFSNKEMMEAVLRIVTEKRDRVERLLFSGQGSPIEAEYMGIIAVLRKLFQSKRRIKHLDLYSSNEVLVNQLNKTYRVSSERLQPLYKTLMGLLENVEFSVYKISAYDMSAFLGWHAYKLEDEHKIIEMLEQADVEVLDLWV